MLTLSKVVVEVGNRADAARAGDYRLELAAAPKAYARTDYQLGEQRLERRSQLASSSLWLGADDALAQFGVRRGETIERDALIAVLQGQHVQTGEQLRRPGMLKREAHDEHGQALVDDHGRPVVERVSGIAHVEMTLSVPKSVSVLWAMSGQDDRDRIEQAVLVAADRTVQYMARNKAVVHRRGKDGVRVREPAPGAAVASSLHVTARRARGDRAPAPQLHVHSLVVGVIRTDGQLVAADPWEWFRRDAALEGGALFRAEVANALVNEGWGIRSGTGHRSRYFEVEGVPESLCEVMSPRSREVAEARTELERELGIRLQGGALAVLAKQTRQAKDHDLDPGRLSEVWDALGQEHGFGPGAGSKLRQRKGHLSDVEARMARTRGVVVAQLREQGPTVSLGRARALVFEASAGRLSADDAARLLARMERPHRGELLALEGGRVTSRDIRRLEDYVMAVAVTAASRETADGTVGAAYRDSGLQAAEAALGDGKQLDPEQREALELLVSGTGWACLTGRAGTGKGPVLHAAAETYRAAGWRVIACAMDGTTARRMAEQLGGQAPSLTVEQLKVRLATAAITVDARTVIFVDEASKLDAGHWAELATAVEHHGARIRAVGHDGQHDAIRLPGLFSEQLRQPRIPTTELCQIHRHRNPDNPGQVHAWLRDYQVAVDESRGVEAVAILQQHRALNLHDTRMQAMGGLVDEWDVWRRDYEPAESALIIHGPNSDVDLVNELAQHKRLQARELGEQTVQAVDRDYLLRPGDLVAVRTAAYTFDVPAGTQRPKRVENGQVGIVESVDPKRDTITLLLREPASEPRLVEIDQARLRAQAAAGDRAAAVRLNYAMHSFPAQGATVRGTSTLAGHWSQAKQETYVGDTRAVYRHSVHVAREDLGLDGTHEDRIARYAQRISENRQRQASIRQRLDPALKLAVDVPKKRPIQTPAASPAAAGPSNRSPVTLPYDKRTAHERSDREALRLEGLRTEGNRPPRPASSPLPTSGPEPAVPARRWQQTMGPTMSR